ncbi:MAG: hypothetical protein KBD40_03260 [Phenylobacterium sp.]|nr:hypothetical protein [Phenylobacterium sp.]
MKFLRPFALILLAPCLATAVLSEVVFHEVSRASFVALPFAILGTAAVATACGWVVEAGWVRWFALVFTVALGAVLGLLSGTDDTMLFGVVYGSGCAAAWVLLDLTVPRRRRSDL